MPFTRDSARRIAQATREAERSPRRDVPDRTGSPRPARLLCEALVTTAITARSGNTPGAGAVTLRYLDPATNAYTALPGMTGIPIKNPYTAAIAINKIVIAGWIDGQWQVVSANC